MGVTSVLPRRQRTAWSCCPAGYRVGGAGRRAGRPRHAGECRHRSLPRNFRLLPGWPSRRPAPTDPAYGGDAGDPDVIESGRDLLRLHDGNRPRQPPAGARRHLRQSADRLAELYRHVIRVDRTAERARLGGRQHPDLSWRLLLRRPLGDVLRRGAGGPRHRHRIRLPVGGDRRQHQPDRCSLHRQLERTLALPIRPRRGHRPQPLHRPRQRDPVAGLEVQRRRFVDACGHLDRAAQQRRHRVPGRFVAHRDLLQQHRLPTPGRTPSRTPPWSRSAASSTSSSAGVSTPRRATPRASPSAPRRPAPARRPIPTRF